MVIGKGIQQQEGTYCRNTARGLSQAVSRHDPGWKPHGHLRHFRTDKTTTATRTCLQSNQKKPRNQYEHVSEA